MSDPDLESNSQPPGSRIPQILLHSRQVLGTVLAARGLAGSSVSDPPALVRLWADDLARAEKQPALPRRPSKQAPGQWTDTSDKQHACLGYGVRPAFRFLHFPTPYHPGLPISLPITFSLVIFNARPALFDAVDVARPLIAGLTSVTVAESGCPGAKFFSRLASHADLPR
jgi:hypothetical protein